MKPVMDLDEDPPSPSASEASGGTKPAIDLDEDPGAAASPPTGKAAKHDLSAFIGLPEHQLVTAVVSRVTTYGLHVDALPPDGGTPCNGLVHISNIKDGFVSEEFMDDSFFEGQELKAYVIKVDTEAGRLSLSLVQRGAEAGGDTDAEAGEDEAAAKAALLSMPDGTAVDVTVLKILKFGLVLKATVEGVGAAVGLCHVSEMIGYVTQESLEEDYPIGKEISVRLLNSETSREPGMAPDKLRFTMRTKEDKPDFEVLKAWPKEEWLEGVIRKVEPFGYITQVAVREQHFTGLVHISQVDTFQKVKEGDTVRVRVLKVDVKNERVNFSMLSKWDLAPFEGLPPEQILDGRIKTVNEFGAFVRVKHPNGDCQYEGLLKTPAKGEDLTKFKEEDHVKVTIKQVNAASGKLQLDLVSPRASSRGPAKPEPEPEGESSTSPSGSSSEEELEPRRVFELCTEGGLPKKVRDTLLLEGYDSLSLLRQLSPEEWSEMREACGLRPSDAAKLRIALGRER